MVGGLIHHATVQLKILKHSLTHLVEHAKEDLGLPENAQVTEKVEEAMYRIISECVEHHKIVIK